MDSAWSGYDALHKQVLTVVNTAGMSSAMGAPFFPGQTLRVTTSGMGITSMLYVDSTNKLKSGLDLPTSLGSLTAAGSGLCVMPAQAYNVTSANLCGNLYLDAGEQCDTGGVTGIRSLPKIWLFRS